MTTVKKIKMSTVFGLAAFASLSVGFAASAATTSAKQSLLIPVTEEESLIRPQREVSGPSAAPAAKPTAAMSYGQKHIAALEKALNGDNAGAVVLLNQLKATAPNADEKDRVMLSIGRVEFQAGHLEQAAAAYSEVRKASASWLESLEERASVEMRMGDLPAALASLKTVMSPLFIDKALSEPYYLAALAQLRMCDYRAFFKTLDLFKERFRTRVKTWEATRTMDPEAAPRLREASETIQKLNLVEAEAIQRLYMDDSGKRMGGKAPKIERGKDQLTFPMDSESDSKEVWLDEVDSYKVTTKGCPALQAAK